MAEIDCNGLDEPCVTWTGGVVTRTGPRQYCYFTWNGAETLWIHPAVTMGLFRAIWLESISRLSSLCNEEEINQFLECCGGKFSKACPTQPPSMCHNMSMGMPVSHLIRGWLPDVASTGSASRLNVSTRDFRVDFTPVLSLLCITSSYRQTPVTWVSCGAPI